MPLFAAILITGVLLTVLAWYGEKTVYAGEVRDAGKDPLIEVVFSGIHDGIEPWQVFTGAGAAPEEMTAAEEADGQADDAQGTQQTEADGTAGADGIAASDGNAGNTENAVANAAGGSTDNETENGGAAVSAASPAGDAGTSTGEEQEPAEGAESSDAGETDSVPAEGGTAETAGDTSSAASADPAENTNSVSVSGNTDPYAKLPVAEKEKNPSYVHADTMPVGVNSPVVPAKDYGTADPRYLSPDGTVYNTDTSGIFAEDGDYWKLQAVDESYFDDALFIGDSRVDGLYTYGNMKNATFFARDAVSVYNIWNVSADAHFPAGGAGTTEADGNDAAAGDAAAMAPAVTERMELTDLLESRQFAKIYFSVGVNELGVPSTKRFYDKYRETITKIRELQPEAVIYVCGMMHVTAAMSLSDSVFNNTAIVNRNTAIATLANGHDIFYIDLNEDLCDANGDLPADMSGDGVHLKAKEYARWKEYLLQNAIVKDAAVKNASGAV